MKKLIVLILCGVTSPVFAQVTVPQVFVDQADKAFLEVAKDREVIAAKDETIAAKNQALAAQALAHDADQNLIAKLRADIKDRDVKIAELSLLKCDTTSFFFIIKVKRCH